MDFPGLTWLVKGRIWISAPFISLFLPSPQNSFWPSWGTVCIPMHLIPDSEMSRGGEIETFSVGNRAVPCWKLSGFCMSIWPGLACLAPPTLRAGFSKAAAQFSIQVWQVVVSGLTSPSAALPLRWHHPRCRLGKVCICVIHPDRGCQPRWRSEISGKQTRVVPHFRVDGCPWKDYTEVGFFRSHTSDMLARPWVRWCSCFDFSGTRLFLFPRNLGFHLLSA